MATFGHSTTGAQVVEYFKDKAKDKISEITLSHQRLAKANMRHSSHHRAK